jgi:hypothetical protein
VIQCISFSQECDLTCPFLFISMSPNSRQRILNVMGTFRPAFRHVAQSLTDIDLILVEEAFERLLLVSWFSLDRAIGNVLMFRSNALDLGL